MCRPYISVGNAQIFEKSGVIASARPKLTLDSPNSGLPAWDWRGEAPAIAGWPPVMPVGCCAHWPLRHPSGEGPGESGRCVMEFSVRGRAGFVSAKPAFCRRCWQGAVMLDVGPTHYATTSDGLSIAYKRWGEGDRDLVLVPGTVFHCEMLFEFDPWRRLGERLGQLGRVICFDKRGTGLSDRHLGDGSLDDRILDVSAVMDDAGVDHATVIGISEGGAMGALVAATLPQRVESLVLAMGLIYGPLCANHPRPDLGRAYAQRALELLVRTWGTGDACLIWLDGPGKPLPQHARRRLEQYMFTPRGLVELMGRNMEIDVRPVLPLIAAPTLVVHATGDRSIPIIQGRTAATGILGAKLVELPLEYHGSWEPDFFDWYADPIEEWLTGRPVEAPVRSNRLLATVVFTDIVGSTAQAAKVGDLAWRRLLDRHDAMASERVARFGGRLIKSTGDGMLATFDGAARALDCVVTLRRDLESIGLRIRAGVHAGEIEIRDRDISGIGVHLAARVLGQAHDEEIWVSTTVPGLVVGSEHSFDLRGIHQLKGIPGEWPLYSLVD